jgi:acyl-CoA reductase-like NAD-dependent aldehyde dehydrogenase
MASGADPRMVQKVEGFGGKIGKLVSDRRVAVVSVTGAESTAQTMMSKRGLRPVKFEGGGVNWAFVDDNFSDEELNKIVVRLTYSKLGFSSHKCTTLHGIMSTPSTMKRLIPLINQEFDKWEIKNPAFADKNETKIIGPCMVHQAQTATEIEKAAKKLGITVIRSGGKITGNDYADNAEVIAPIILGNVKPNSMITVNWDSKGEITFDLSATELFMPILCLNEVEKFDEFLRFCLFHNEHDLAVSIWTKDSKKIELSKKVLGGMLKINDGTDSAMEWEEFGASGLTGSGNMGVGDPEATFAIYSRRQKGRFVEF